MPSGPDVTDDGEEASGTGRDVRLDVVLGELDEGPGSVAALGARAARLLDAVAERPPASDAAEVDGGAVGKRGPRFATLADCAAAAPGARAAAALLTLDALDGDPSVPGTLDRALGTACRLYPTRLLLFVDAAEAPPPETLFAFGFRRLTAGADAVLHEYRLRDYKTPPDWLNARFWANPARFDLDTDEDAALDATGDEDEDEEDDDEEE